MIDLLGATLLNTEEVFRPEEAITVHSSSVRAEESNPFCFCVDWFDLVQATMACDFLSVMLLLCTENNFTPVLPNIDLFLCFYPLGYGEEVCLS